MKASLARCEHPAQAETHDHRPVFMGAGSRCARPGRRWSDAFWLNEPNCDFGQTKQPTNGKPCAVFGASVSPLGTARGQFHFRHICVSLNMIPVNTPHVDITNAKTKFDAQGRLTDQASIDLIRQLVGELRNLTVHLRDTQDR
jgi:hypothetical protein